MLATQALPARPLPRHRPYQPFGRMHDLLLSRAGEIMLAGPAGTGKSRGNLEKVHLCAERYPGMRALVVRKTASASPRPASSRSRTTCCPKVTRCSSAARA